jgi:hypothetical protein
VSFYLASVTLRRTHGYASRHNGGDVCVADICDEVRHANFKTPISPISHMRYGGDHVNTYEHESFECDPLSYLMGQMAGDTLKALAHD